MTETSNYVNLNKCLCCESQNLTPILDLHDQPLANSYPNDKDQLEYHYPLLLNYCLDCTHLQLSIGVNPDYLFKNYLYVSGTTETLRKYFDDFVKNIVNFYMASNGPFKVLDIACNDGSQLDAFKKYGHETYGIDPAENLFSLSSKNHHIVCEYFNENAVTTFNTKFDVIVAQNVLAHNTYPDHFLNLCKKYLTNNGKIFIQTSQSDMVKYGQFDTIYHEHVSFFNINSMATLAAKSQLFLEDVVKTDIHGTSYVFVLTPNILLDNSKMLIEKEPRQCLDTVTNFAKKAVNVVSTLKTQLSLLDGYYKIGYGAAAKGNTLLNFGEINLDYIVDDNPLKQGLYTPGRKIKILSLDDVIKVTKDKPIVWIPLSWNFFEEIKYRIKQKHTESCVFIKYFPEFNIEFFNKK